MNYEVSFWGAAEGKNIWTRQDADRFYYETFYSNRERENGLWIEVRPSDDVLYVYYSYVIRENVLEKDSRPGSHFGLSLRLSVYCRNVFGIYEILDATFDNFFRDKLIKVNEGNTYRFLQNPQEFGKNKHTEIEQFVEKQLKNFFHEEDFVPINITHSGSSPKKVNLLDAKYYKYGVIRNPGLLPKSTDINKQITYGEYIAEQDKFKKMHGENYKVYNAFIMPFDALKSGSEKVLRIGQATSNWKSGMKEYEKVQGILVDVKHLMKIGVCNDYDEMSKLADCISKYV